METTTCPSLLYGKANDAGGPRIEEENEVIKRIF